MNIKLKFGLSVFCSAILWSCFFVSFARADSVFISQIQITGGSGHTTDDFVELFNPNPNPFNLKGYRLVKRTASGTADTLIKSWTSDTNIPPYSFFLWANSAFTSISKTPDATTTGSIANDNGVAVRLGASDTGVIIDSAAWGSTANTFANISPTNPGAGQAMWRRDLYSAVSSFSVAAANPRNISVADSGAPVISVVPTASSSPATTSASTDLSGSIYLAKSSDVKITEILPNPTGEDSGAEVVELQNSGDAPVNLEGWMLDDKSEGGVKQAAVKISGQSILPGGFLVLVIPKGHFVLNNSGGDALNLYFADKSPADSVSYSETAAEGQSYQKFGSSWVWAQPTLGQENFGATSKVAGNYQVYINEILPNPAGDDSGKEWVEIYNSSSAPVNLKGFILDDDAAGEPGSTAWTLDEKAVVPAGGYLVLNTPEDKFSLGNEADAVRFFSPDKKLLDRVLYAKAPEAESYSRSEKGEWQWGLPTQGAQNIVEIPEYKIRLSEILPNPAGDDEEFVELQNVGTEKVDLKNFKIVVGSKSSLLAGAVIKPGEYFTLYADDLPARLRNSGQTVEIYDPLGRKTDSAGYPKAEAGQAYALAGPGKFLWTESPTPSAENKIVLSASTAGPAQNAGLAGDKKDTNKPESSTGKASAEILALNKKMDEMGAKIDQLTNIIAAQQADAANTGADLTSDPTSAGQAENPAPNAGGPIRYLILSFAALGLLALVVWKYFFR